MSSAVISTSAALGRPFVFDDDADPEVSSLQDSCGDSRPRLLALSGVEGSGRAKLDGNDSLAGKILPSSVTPASRLNLRPAPEMVSSGIPAIDALTGGLPRGCLTEICGPASSGRTTVLLAAVAAATRRGEFCVVVDASDALDPHSAAAGVELDRLLWVRCGEDAPPQRHPSTALRACPEPVEGARSATEKTISKDRSSDGCPISRASFAREVGTRDREIFRTAFDFDRSGLKENGSRQSEHRLEQVLRATDLLLESGGFGLIVLDLSDLPLQSARRIPLTTWFRFRRAVENKPTILLAIEQHPIAGSCSSLLLQLGASDSTVDESAERHKNAAHGASRGFVVRNNEAPEGRKKINLGDQSATTDPNTFDPTHAQLLTGLNITAELIRSRLDRKPARSVAFETKTAWAG